jgi:hypothetical protein
VDIMEEKVEVAGVDGEDGVNDDMEWDYVGGDMNESEKIDDIFVIE